MGKNKTKKNNFGTKKSKLSALPIVLSSLIAGGAIAGSAVSIWHISQNYTESADFTKSVTGRVSVDPLAGYPEEQKSTLTESEVKNTLQDCAERLSRWLKDRGQKSYDVSYEVYFHEDFHKTEPDKWVEAYLNANFEVEKVESKRTWIEDKVDNDPYLSFFSENGFNSNEKTIVYRWYIPVNTKEGYEPKYTVIPFRDLFDVPDKVGDDSKSTKVIVDENGKNGVVFSVKDTVTMRKIFKNLTQAEKDSKIDKDEEKPLSIKNAWGQPRLYIVNNMNGLFNEANYHLSNWWSNKEDDKYLDLYVGSQYETFATKYQSKKWDGEDRPQSDDLYQRTYRLQSAKKYDEDGNDETNIPNMDIFNYVDQATAGTYNNEVSFAPKYVQTIITYDKINDFMPKQITEDYKNDTEGDEPNIKYFWYSQTTKNEAEAFLNRQINYGFNKAAIKGIDFSDISTQGILGSDKVFTRFVENCSHKYVDASFKETIFGGSSVIGILSLGFLIFLVILLILLAVLYRTTGVMSWICMIFALSMTLLISTVNSMAISMSLIFGLFTMAIVGFVACLAICGRMKRRLHSREDTQLMIKKTFKQSLLPIVDISMITLIFGVCFTYIAPISLNPLGIVLITGAFAIFISIYLLNAALHGLFFNNNYLVNKYQFFGKNSNKANELLAPESKLAPSSMDATRLEFPYYSTMSTKKLDTTNKRALIATAVVGGILVIAIVLFLVLGYTSSRMFQTTTCVAIKYDNTLLEQFWFKDLSYLSYRHDLESGWWYFYTNANNAYEVAQQMASTGGLQFGSTIVVQYIFGSTNQDILNFALTSIIVATLCSALYGAIRFNWISFVPMVVGTFGMPLIILGLSAAFQVKFDQFVVVIFVFTTVINTIFSASVSGNLADSWSRKDPYNKVEFKYIVNTALTNSWGFIWQTAAAYLLFIVLFGITSPVSTSTPSMIALLAISFVVTMAFVPVTLSFLTYQFMKIRNVLLNKLFEKNKNKVVKDYDDIDEQGIEGINKFTKYIPVAKEAPEETK